MIKFSINYLKKANKKPNSHKHRVRLSYSPAAATLTYVRVYDRTFLNIPILEYFKKINLF